MILLCNQQSFICTHVDFCHPRCYQHHSRSCARLVRAIKLVYGDTVDSLREDGASSGNIGARAKKNKEVGLAVRPCSFIYLFFEAVLCHRRGGLPEVSALTVFRQVLPADPVHEEETHGLQRRREEGYRHAQVHPQPGAVALEFIIPIHLLYKRTHYKTPFKYSGPVISLSACRILQAFYV